MSAAPGGAYRRRLLQACAGLLAVPACSARAGGEASCANPSGWPAWDSFQSNFLRSGGRILDPASPRGQTVSEAQSYALFFALVAGDRGQFEHLLRWTEDNLAGGDLAVRLPAWLWGRHDDGSYGVLDANSASDADLWLSYVLGEAGRLWEVRRYQALSSLLAERILQEETGILPGLGRTLLPGAQGFSLDGGSWRLNPSYVPPFLLRWFASRSGDARWRELLQTSLRMLRESAPRGLAPDWTMYRATAGFDPDGPAASDRVGGYDAIRVYLWIGMTAAEDPERAALLQHFQPMAELTERGGAPPEAVDVRDATASGTGPAGFSAALLPFLAAMGRTEALHAQENRLQGQALRPDAYYEQALGLFGLGFRDGRFSFGPDGGLMLRATSGPAGHSAQACPPGVRSP